jgi:hypothetical protein
MLVTLGCPYLKITGRFLIDYSLNTLPSGPYNNVVTFVHDPLLRILCGESIVDPRVRLRESTTNVTTLVVAPLLADKKE